MKKLGIILCLTFFLPLTAEANMLLKNAIESFEPPDMNSPVHCHKSEQRLKKPLQAVQNINFGLSCNITCRGKELEKVSINDTLNTENEQLAIGDGSSSKTIAFGSFTAAMEVWGEGVCLRRAQSICESLPNVESVQLESIKHKKWNELYLPKKHCLDDSTVQNMIVPYETKKNQPSENNTYSELLRFKGPSSKTNISAQNIDFNFEEVEIIDPSLKSPCKKILNGTICYGDCYSVSGIGTEKLHMMIEKTGNEVRQQSICADHLYKYFEDNPGLSDSVRKSICNAFYFKTLIHQQVSGTSCSAFRGTTDC